MLTFQSRLFLTNAAKNPLIKARICWHMLTYAHICVEKCQLFFYEPILTPGAISKLGEVFPLPQALFFGSKMAFLRFCDMY